MSEAAPNRLAREHSPYLLQHAHNPVDWYPWGDEALARARAEDRPLFVSVGYAACHWCHVMERESFADPETAALLNAHFVCVKVDREERPDVDAFVIDALLHLTGEAGWPASLWLTPDLQPFYGGTYFPPWPRYSLPGFRDLLRRLAEEWTGHREGLLRRAAEVRAAIAPPVASGAPPSDAIGRGVSALLRDYDRRCGGWGDGAKFPQCPRVELLIERGRRGDRAAAETALHLLDVMDRSGIHDHVGGGWHRYATDGDWEIPHFEKMLYDNAQLLRVYARAWAAGGPDRLLTVAGLTAGYLLDTLRAPSGAFWSSQDADDPEGEGAYYTWTREELREAVGAHAEALAVAYGVTMGGNFERGRTVLRRKVEGGLMSALRGRLRAARARRPAPATDTKEVVAWNGLAISALASFGALSGDAAALGAAEAAAAAVLAARRPDGALPRTLAPGSPPAVLDDHALLAEGLLDLHAATGQARWLLAASEIARVMLARFVGPDGLLLASPPGSPLPPRPAAWEEGAEPAGPAVAGLVLHRLIALGDRGVPEPVLEAALAGLGPILARRPDAAPTALRLLALRAAPPRTLVLAGEADDPALAALRRAALRAAPEVVCATLTPELLADGRFSAFEGKRPGGRARAYLCEGATCLAPISDPAALIAALGA